jgi:hypothetical protein
MNLDDILNEKIKKVHGKWALVSKSNPDKVLQYYHGKDHPSKEWEKKVERRVHAFSEAESLDKTVDRMRNLNIDDIEHLKRYSNPQLKDWLKRLTAANKNNIGSALNTLDTMGPIAKPFAKSFVQKQFPGIDDTEFDQAWKFWQETDPATRSAVTKGDLTTLDPRDEHGFVKEEDDYDAWLEKAKKRAEKQAAKKRAELQQVMKGIETDPEKLALQDTIQAARGELSKRKREALEKMEKLAQVYSKFSNEELDKIIGRYSKGPGAGSDFVEWLKSIKQEREDEHYGIQQRKDLFKSVAGTMQSNQSQKAAPAQGKPWTQLGMTRDEFRKILNNPQHPRHREIKQLQDQYKQVDEDLTRRDFLKGVAGGAMAFGAMKAANALGLKKDPTKTDDPDEQYARFTGTNPAPLHASPRLDLANKYNRVGVNQRGSQFSVVLTKKHGLYLYIVTTDFAKDPYVYIELKGGEKYKFRKRTLNNNTFTIEDDRIAATLLNYEGPFNVYVDNDVYTFNILSSPDAQKLYRWWKEGKHEGL